MKKTIALRYAAEDDFLGDIGAQAEKLRQYCKASHGIEIQWIKGEELGELECLILSPAFWRDEVCRRHIQDVGERLAAKFFLIEHETTDFPADIELDDRVRSAPLHGWQSEEEIQHLARLLSEGQEKKPGAYYRGERPVPDRPIVDNRIRDRFDELITENKLIGAARYLLKNCPSRLAVERNRLQETLRALRDLLGQEKSYRISPIRAELQKRDHIDSLRQIASVVCPTQAVPVLCFGASSIDSVRLRVTEEFRDIQRLLERKDHSERFDFATELSPTMLDLRRVFTDRVPRILHFSGHGTEEGLEIENENGTGKIISRDFFCDFLRLHREPIECVVLNACYSETTGGRIAEFIPHVIAIKGEIRDRISLKFSETFYEALFAGRRYDHSFENALLFTAAELDIAKSQIPIRKF
ncbi:MAG: CHAT domain-containing protein [Bacteroidota bacterium]